jgi:hypothetical protein
VIGVKAFRLTLMLDRQQRCRLAGRCREALHL